MMIDRCSIDTDTLELPTRGRHDLDAEEFSALEFSAEDDAKISRAANRGPIAIKAALAGDPRGRVEMAALGITLWQHRREG